jgi:hypothetical protein
MSVHYNLQVICVKTKEELFLRKKFNHPHCHATINHHAKRNNQHIQIAF